MIISSFNRYFEKHGRKTYIVLGIIISVIFVFSLGGGMDSCGYREPGLKTFGKMYGKTLKAKDTMEQMRRADLGYTLRTGMSLGRQNKGDYQLLQLTLQRMRALHKAHELGLDKVSDAELMEAIQSQPIFGGKENFSKQRYVDFINNYMIPNRMSGGDLDEIIKENLIIDRLEEKAVEGVEVTEDEVNEYLEKYTISQHDFMMDLAKDSAPSDDEIAKFFETRKGELTLDDQKKAVVATIAVDDVVANAALKAQVEPKEEELKDMFEKGKAHLYKDKKYEDVKDAIQKQVSRRKASEFARKAIADLAAKVAEKPVGETPEQTIARFTKLAEAAGAKVVTTGFFSNGDTIPGMTGNVTSLARGIRALNQVGAVTKEVATIGAFNVAVLAEQKAGEMPTAINDEVKAKISDKLIGEKAMAWFNENIAPYKDKVAGLESVWDLIGPFQKELEDKKLDEEAMMAEYSKYQEYLSDNVMPFFKEELRSAKIVAFKPVKFEGRFEITEAEKKAEYEARKAEFEKKQVRMSKIAVNLDAEKAEENVAKKAKLTEMLGKLKEGKDFKDLVAEYSEDIVTKSKQGDTGLVDVTTLDENIAKTVLDMEINQVSGILETKDSLMVVKLLEKDMGKTYEDPVVQADLVKSITADRTKNLAADAAHAFSTRFTEACDQNDKAGADKKAMVEVFEELVAAGVPDAEIIDLPYSAKSASIPGFGNEYQLMNLLFSRTSENPCTYMVAGQNASYVACLKDIKPSYLAIPSAEDPAAFNRLKNLYRKETAMAALKKTAEEKAAAINKELAAGTPLDKAAGAADFFKPVKDAFDFMNVQQNRDLHAKDKMGLLKALHRGKVGTVLEPVKTYTGYDLVYLDKRELKDDEDSKRLAEQIKTSLGNRKKGRKLAEYYEQLEAESNTQLVEGLVRQK